MWRSRNIVLLFIGTGAALAAFTALDHDDYSSTTRPSGYSGSHGFFSSHSYYGGGSSSSSHATSTSHGGFGSTGHAAHS